jgi:hypothetical protein
MTGLVRGYGLVFHIVENQARLRLVRRNEGFPFWDRISRQGLGLPLLKSEVETHLGNRIQFLSFAPPGLVHFYGLSTHGLRLHSVAASRLELRPKLPYYFG